MNADIIINDEIADFETINKPTLLLLTLIHLSKYGTCYEQS